MTAKVGCGAIILTARYRGDGDHPFLQQIDSRPRILLTRRGFGAPTCPGAWACPAGLKEENEHVESAVRREAMEEVGINFLPEPEPFYKGRWGDRELFYFLGEWDFIYQHGVHLETTYDNERKLHVAESIGYDWCTYEEALGKELAFKYHDAVLKARHEGYL